MSLFTVLFGLFTIFLYLYLFVVRRSIVIPVVRKKGRVFFWLSLSGLTLFVGIIGTNSLNEKMQLILAAVVFFSFLLDGKGLTEEAIVLFGLDNRGIPYEEIDRVVLLQDEEKGLVKMNFFWKGRRGPLLLLDYPLTELTIFFYMHLEQGSSIEVVTKEE